jgi:hypothetical protein
MFMKNNPLKILKTVRHGDPMECPTCGAPGRFDKMSRGVDRNEPEYDNAVFYLGEGE